jgi:hypothetical protein
MLKIYERKTLMKMLTYVASFHNNKLTKHSLKLEK